MSSESWLQPHLVVVLQNGLGVLRDWRKQANLQGRIKNLENWILVELNHQLIRSGFARVVLTNGFFKHDQDVPVKRVRAASIPGLRGRKSKATYISADLSVRPTSHQNPDGCLIAELKTGMAANELLDDLRLVRYYRDEGIATSAELGWVVILPEDAAVRSSCEKTVQKIRTRLLNEPGGCTLMPTTIEDWLVVCVAIPTQHVPPNTAMLRTAFGRHWSPSRYADALGRRCAPFGRSRLAPHLRARRLTVDWPGTAPAVRSRRIGAAALGRRVLGPLARPIPRLEPACALTSRLACAPAAQPPPRWASRARDHT